MVNATTQTTNTTQLPPTLQPVSASPQPMSTAQATVLQTAKPNGINQMKKNFKLAMAGLMMFVLLAGGGVALFLSQEEQDTRNQASTNACMDAPLARNPAVTKVNDTQFKLQWNQVAGASGYRIFLITEGEAGTHPSGKYIIFNVLDNSSEVSETPQFVPIVPANARSLSPTQTEYVWTLPANDVIDLEGKVVRERPYYRFLVFAFKTGTSCTSQAAIGTYTSPAATPTPTSTFVGACTENRPKVDNRQANWIENNSKIQLTWTLTSGKASDYEIWNLGNGTLQDLGPEKYYLKNLTPKPLAGSATSFTIADPNSLTTRRFLIRAVSQRNAQGGLACYDQWELCIAPVVLDRKVTMADKSTAVFEWNPVQAPKEKYQIWLIAEGTPEEIGNDRYYIALLADNVDSNSKSLRLSLPEKYQNLPSYRFLIRAINYSAGGAPQCYNQWALAPNGTGGTQVGQCTIRFTIEGPTATPTITATPNPSATVTPTARPSSTPTPTPTSVPGATATPTTRVTPVVGCNAICVTNADCSNPAHICFVVSETENRCRLESNPMDMNCQNPVAAVTEPAEVAQQPALPETLPETGPEDWGNWLKAGLAILGIGAALLLML
ncbi:hypothetical protein KBC89_03200 [Candidatus Woesebacteria bacterium]|nr:hypothetical protein [Candidatus Woesebacteria bacterium]